MSRRLAFVTGASSGLGAAFADKLAKRGYDLVIVARRRDRLEKLAERIRHDHAVEVKIVQADLADRASLQHVVELISSLERLDFLVNAAGLTVPGRFSGLNAARVEQEMLVNLCALIMLTRAALPKMNDQQQGYIVNIASTGGLLPQPYAAVYGATKAGVVSFCVEESLSEIEASGKTVFVPHGPNRYLNKLLANLPRRWSLAALGGATRKSLEIS